VRRWQILDRFRLRLKHRMPFALVLRTVPHGSWRSYRPLARSSDPAIGSENLPQRDGARQSARCVELLANALVRWPAIPMATSDRRSASAAGV